MATMICGAMDWTFDLFAEAMNSVEALPMERGVRPSKNLSEAQRFAQYVKTYIKFAMKGYETDYCSWDYVVSRTLSDMNFSDWYKDVFNQRPHFSSDFVGALCGVHGSSWTTRSFCAWPMEDAISNAKRTREWLEQEAMAEYQRYGA